MPSTGEHVGPYELLSLLGKGGMGEVWKARDPRVGRIVAVKFSNRDFGDRFSREARAIAALNHPNICHLYDVGPNYLVMEYIEGENPKGPLPLGLVLDYARQIADALEEAHEKGITHRDLKPGNIKITPTGKVKVLDFGLAKLSTTSANGTGEALDPENSPTMSMALTGQGVILGTAAYMSPEQARGKEVDKRSDIWSYGVILYELITGKKPFGGETITDVIAAIVTKDPDWEPIPSKARRLIQACLEKDPKRRLRDIGDISRLIEPDGSHENVDEPLAEARARNTYLAWTIAAVFAIAAGSLAFLHFRTTQHEATLVTSAILPPDGQTFHFNLQASFALPALSPDGKKIVFGATSPEGKSQLWLRLLDSPSPQPLVGTEGGVSPFWAPDSRWIGFATQDNKLRKIDSTGGTPVTIADIPSALRGATWTRDGIILFGVVRNSPILQVPATGGAVKPATVISREKQPNGHRYPWLLPDGRHFLYTAPNEIESTALITSLDEPDSPGVALSTITSNIMYAQGHLLFLRGNTLMAQPFDSASRKVTGDPVRLAEDIPYFLNPGRIGAFTVSETGLLAYWRGASGTNHQLYWADRNGKELAKLGEPIHSADHLQLAPDQKTLALQIEENNNLDIWTIDVQSGLRSRFTFDPSADDTPLWSPDGRVIAWRSRREGPYNLYWRQFNGSGVDQKLLSDAQSKFASSFAPNGKSLLYVTSPYGQNGIWVLPFDLQTKLATSTPYPLNPKATGSETFATFSPDGRWIAYNSNESGRFEVYIVPFKSSPAQSGSGKIQVSNGGGSHARWRRDGKELFYLTLDRDMTSAEIIAENGSLRVGRTQLLFKAVETQNGYPYDVSADGQKFILMRNKDAVAASPPVTLIQNWTALLK